MSSSIQKTLVSAGRLMKVSSVCLGVLWWLVTCLGAWLALFVLDNLLHLPTGLRFPLAVAGGLLLAAGFVGRVYAPVARRQRNERTATLLERRCGIGENLLINACHLETQRLSSAEAVFAGHTVRASMSAVGGVTASRLMELPDLRRWGLGALVVVAAWVLYCIAFPHYAANAFARYSKPLGDIAPTSSFAVRVVPSSDAMVVEGDDLDVQAEVRAVGRGPARTDEIPLIVWLEGAGHVGAQRTAGESGLMRSPEEASGAYTYTFRRIRRAFSFRVFCADTYSESVHVDVRPLPRVKSSYFRVTPPAYTGHGAIEHPGPPAALSGLPGSSVEVGLTLDRPVASAAWKAQGKGEEFAVDGSVCRAATTIAEAGSYEIDFVDPLVPGKRIAFARGEINLEKDRPPEIDFLTEDRNRFVNPGAKLRLDLQASDDFGVSSIGITMRRPDQEGTNATLKTWTYLGPPGNPGPVKETFVLEVRPEQFQPGMTYLLEASCRDFHPAGQQGKSRPIVLRVKSWGELETPSADRAAKAFELLKQTIAEQRTALAMTENVQIHIEEAVAGETLHAHRSAMKERQKQAQTTGRAAVQEFKKSQVEQVSASRLATLVEDEMSWAIKDVSRVEARRPQTETEKEMVRVMETSAETETQKSEADTLLPEFAGAEKAGPKKKLPPNLAFTYARLKRVSVRQEYILNELILLLGRISGDRTVKAKEKTDRSDEAPKATVNDAGKQLKEDLDKFTREQERIVKKTATLKDKGPEDLTDKEEKIVGELAREEEKWARYFEEKLTDFSKLPLQDFADGSLSKQLNEVYQDVKKAEKSLYDKKAELAVPMEQSGLEKATELMHNLERWLANAPDQTKWNMEEPPNQADIPLAELPSELEDIVGKLLDKEEEMTEEVEDVTSSWIDSADKGIGWDALDGPISDMSAKGVSGNLLPNQQEIGGRGGEGRTGRSQGQMVQDAAEGKKGRETPTRLSPTPFERGSVKDSSKESTGGATGGGKMSGFTGEGLRGPAQPPRLEDMARLGGQQAKIRQEAEVLALKLRSYHLPTGDLEGSIEAMKRLEGAASRGDGLVIRRAFGRVLDSLEQSRSAVRSETGLHMEYSKLPEWTKAEIMSGLRDGTPKGYSEIISAYFKILAEQEQGARR